MMKEFHNFGLTIPLNKLSCRMEKIVASMAALRKFTFLFTFKLVLQMLYGRSAISKPLTTRISSTSAMAEVLMHLDSFSVPRSVGKRTERRL